MKQAEPLPNHSILIVLSGQGYYRNYISTDAFQYLRERYDVHFLLADDIDIGTNSKLSNLHRYKVNPRVAAKHLRIFNLLMWRHRKKSSSFKFRFSRFGKVNLSFPEPTLLAVKVCKILWRYIQWILIRLENHLIVDSPFFPLYIRLFISRLPFNSELSSILAIVKPVLIIYPSSAYEPIGNDIVLEGKHLDIRTLCLVDNWDNLSSKSVLWNKPSYISVWGEQSSQHAQVIQGFAEDQVFYLGTPRFDSYFRLRDQDLQSPYPFQYILFVGTTLPFKENLALQAMNEVLKKNQSIFKNIKIIYRPHPWRQGSDSIDGMNLEHVIVDEQLKAAYFKKDFSESVQPSISYYPNLLKNALFVTGGLTSMIVEATIFRKIFVALIHDDGTPVTNPSNVYTSYTHFKGIDRMQNIYLSPDLLNVENNFLDAMKNLSLNNNDEIDAQRSFFYYDNGERYSNNLYKLATQLIENK